MLESCISRHIAVKYNYLPTKSSTTVETVGKFAKDCLQPLVVNRISIKMLEKWMNEFILPADRDINPQYKHTLSAQRSLIKAPLDTY